MSSPTYFMQECPTCGRTLQIKVEYLGRSVVCQHCRGNLVATDSIGLRADRGEDSFLGDAFLGAAKQRRLRIFSRESDEA